MTAERSVTRVPGLLYLLTGVPTVFSLQYLPARMIVPGDAAATAHRITAAAFTYRVGTLCDLLSNIGFVLLAASLYEVFKGVDGRQARLLVLWVAISASIGLANEINRIAPLVLLGGGDFLAPFTRAQLEALAMGFLRLHSAGMAIQAAFWGLWLFPFGVLVIRSGFLPKVLGGCLIIGGFAYLAQSVASLGFPAYRQIVSTIALPLYAVGELPIAFWLLAKGVRAPR